jgi:hypothetical protein
MEYRATFIRIPITLQNEILFLFLDRSDSRRVVRRVHVHRAQQDGNPAQGGHPDGGGKAGNPDHQSGKD